MHHFLCGSIHLKMSHSMLFFFFKLGTGFHLHHSFLFLHLCYFWKKKAVWSWSSSEVAPWSFCHKDTYTKSTGGRLYSRRKGEREPGQVSVPECGLSHAFKGTTIARTLLPLHSCSEEMFLIQTRKITPGLCIKYSCLPFNPGGTSTVADCALR